MALSTALSRRLGCDHPIIQAPMAGGPTTVALVAEVCRAGGFGTLAAAYLTPGAVTAMAAELRAEVAAPFGINVFAPLPPPAAPADPGPALARLAPFAAELDLPAPTVPPAAPEPFAEHFAAALDSGARMLSFTFGILPGECIAAAQARGMLVAGTATTVEEAVLLQQAGVDAVVAQGAEAGAHRGTFAAPFEQAMIGTLALVPQVVDAVTVPVIASGGIMDGRGIAAALTLGAQAVQMGTAFLPTAEAGAPPAHKQAILAAREDATRLTRAFSGRPARGIVNRFMEAVGDAAMDFPLQNSATRPIRAEAARRGDAGLMSLWAGQGVRLARSLPAAELVRRLAEETAAACARLGALG